MEYDAASGQEEVLTNCEAWKRSAKEGTKEGDHA